MTDRMPQSELRARTAYRLEHGSEEGFIPAPRTRKKRDNEEFRIQSAFVKLWRANCGRLGVAECLGFSIPNGSVMGGGNAEWQKKERAIRGRLQKLSGQKNGVCDFFISVPKMRPESYGGNVKWWHGFYIEFKKPGEYYSDDQKIFVAAALACDYRCEIHTDPNEAWRAVEKYLKL